MNRKKRCLRMLSAGAIVLAIAGGSTSCNTARVGLSYTSVDIPYLKNSPNECYYLDEFMPTPDGMVSGRQGSMSLRYYTYRVGNYKKWLGKQIMLSFYSKDDRCWSLFEEYYAAALE